MRLSGVIFDLDGTLGDTVPVCLEAISRSVDALTGKSYTHREIMARFGPSEEGILGQLVPPEDVEAGYRHFLREYESLHESGDYGVFPGIPEVIDLLRAHQVPVAVVTGKGPVSARISLRYFGLADAFEMVEAGSPEGPIKEACIRKVAEAWQVPLEEIVYVGDAPLDVVFARQAGTQPVSVAWAGTHTPEELAAENPDQVFTRVADFHDWLARQVNGFSE